MRRPSEKRPKRTEQDINEAALLSDPVVDEEAADELLRRGIAEVQATWTEEMRLEKSGEARRKYVEITEIAMGPIRTERYRE